MRTMVLALSGVAAAWAAAPVLDLTVRGTRDQRAVDGWRSVTPRLAPPLVAIPAPRSGEAADRIPA